VSDVEIKRTEMLTRHEAADQLAALASALRESGRVEMALGNSTLKLHVPDHVRYEVELEIEEDELELELELKWSTTHEHQPTAAHAKERAPTGRATAGAKS
jgi:amphi-Trp domain-containing protein